MIETNFHTHTFRCRHAKGNDEDYVLCAIEKGIKVLGFSDHEEITDKRFYDFNHDDLLDDYTFDYIDSISKLKEKYKDKIEIHIGLESTYFEGKEEHFFSLAKSGIEYLILGQHDLKDENGQRYYMFSKPFDDSGLDKYANQVISGMRTGLYSYLAHPDLFMCPIEQITNKTIDTVYKICDAAKTYNIPLEINLAGYLRKEKYKYPCEEFFKIASELKNEVIIGFDAHYPEWFFDAPLNLGEEFIKKLNLKQVKTIDFTKLKRNLL